MSFLSPAPREEEWSEADPFTMAPQPVRAGGADAGGFVAPLAETLDRAMRGLDARMSGERAVVYLADPKRRRVDVAATYRIPVEDLRPRYGLGIAGRVCDGGRPIVVPVVCEEPMALFELAEPAAWHDRALGAVCVPVLVQGRCRGALSVYFMGRTAPFSERVTAVRAMATAVAHSLARTGAPATDDDAVRSSARTARAAFEYANMIGASAVMRRVYEEIGQVARTTATALILGESGTGKELVAQAIHDNSDRASRPFIKLNGAAFPETLFESELFGHERGAFTGALSRKKGRLDLAQGGTLFLDEIGELPLSTQVKLLRVLQSREYERLGGTETLKADVRLVAATNKDMAAAVASGVFREDLYYRLNVFTIVLPPLRDRAADIAALSEFFLEKYAGVHRRAARRISSGALDVLCRHGWPGNVRELENAIERAVVVCAGPVVEEHHLPETVRAAGGAAPDRHPLSLAEAVEQLERRLIGEALEQSGGNLARAARALGTTERILRYKTQKYDLSVARRRP